MCSFIIHLSIYPSLFPLLCFHRLSTHPFSCTLIYPALCHRCPWPLHRGTATTTPSQDAFILQTWDTLGIHTLPSSTVCGIHCHSSMPLQRWPPQVPLVSRWVHTSSQRREFYRPFQDAKQVWKNWDNVNVPKSVVQKEVYGPCLLPCVL